MAEPYATVDDYTKQTGTTLSEARAAQVAALLASASAIIRSKLPTGYEPDPEITKMIVIQMVERRLTNPGGRRSKQVGQTAETYDQDGGLYLSTREEEQLLAGYNEEGASGAYTIGLRDEAFPDCPTRPYEYRRW